YVPGHGEPVGRVGVETLREHVHAVKAEASRLAAAGVDLDSLDDALPTDDSRSWDFAFPFYAANLQFLMERLGT
ncbi:MAG TPA: hypothetical protein VFD39_06990, partial [Trueperaceae bacterium]|nr:hypothetical protein [Trueperaceae bacterium]